MVGRRCRSIYRPRPTENVETLDERVARDGPEQVRSEFRSESVQGHDEVLEQIGKQGDTH